MNKSKKLVFAFFISASLMNAKCLLHNSVHAAGIMPNPQDSSYVSDSNIFTKYGYKGQCTWFTYGRVLEKLSINLPSEFYGNAVDWWYANAKDKVYSYGSEPKANSIIVWGGGNKGYGHVAFVEKVEGDTVYFNEGNFSVRGAYDGQLKTLSKEEIKNRGNLFLKGYIYLSSPSTPSSPSSNSGQPIAHEDSKSDKGLVNTSSYSSPLNVRSGANASSGVIGSLKKGTAVNIVAVSGDWYKIQYNSSYGYVSSKYISLNAATPVVAASTSTNASTSTSTSNKFGVVNLSNKSSSLNLRSNPSGNVISSLPYGAKVQILESSGKWYKVNSNGAIGYVSSDYISVSSANTNASVSTNTVAKAQPQVQANGKVGTVKLSNKNSTLNLRSAPWTGRVLSELSFGSKVQILASNGRWYKVQAGSSVGFVHSDYISL
ncbi:SH3 domain-containing protein [Clostridium sp. P21]|uniref:N-acetylmuramoyl-L-alanine amidase n=1 Tax=Clostridium muellerianum TaxID=2716538 RepID=A0A7Y0EJQ4_9CLOT|nr:SH3 domain-containing protein [Clostridium muellerianum]NMM64700.1 SH3 domain-containing protein [Clostridium muellerianum]